MQMRVVSVAIMVTIVFVILVGRLWYLQVLTGEDYALSAEATQTREVKIPAQRGVIYDRNGDVLANNGPGLNVTVIPSSLERRKVEKLAEILGADRTAVLDRYDLALQNNPYASMLVKENADKDAITYISERTQQFPGVTVNEDWVRNYPGGKLAAHILGYTGAVTEDELRREPFTELSNDAVVGKGGAELEYEKLLRGKAGKKEYSVDALGRVVTTRRADGTRADGQPEVSPELGRPDKITDPVSGKNLALTLDLELQKVAGKELDAAIERARKEGYAGTGGAIVALDPRNGEILAMASRPDFDPRLFVGGITGPEEAKVFEYLYSEQANQPFTIRALSGSFPAASAFKVFTGMAGLENGTIDPSTTVTDTGQCWQPTGVTGGCWQSWRENGGFGVHDIQNYAEALGDSNDKFFYQVADWMWQQTGDEDLLPKFYERWGFGEATGVDLPGETPGRVPTREWEQEYYETIGKPEEAYWSVGDWVNLSIGQGDLLASPLQLVRGYAAIQNGGTLVTPHVGKEVLEQNGKLVEEISPRSAGRVEVSASSLENTIEGLRMVTAEEGTAGYAVSDSRLPLVGKTGTGEMWGNDPVNWFAGWAEGQEKPLVVVAMVEGGGAFETGSEMTAAPAARHVLEAYHGAEPSPRDPFPAATLETE